MSRSSGTGWPIFLRCSKCRRGSFGHLGRDLVRTGRARPLRGRSASVGCARTLGEQVEYECRDCGHVGWTRMRAILDRPLRTAPGSREARIEEPRRHPLMPHGDAATLAEDESTWMDRPRRPWDHD